MRHGTPLVSVVMPVRDAARYLEDALDSVWAQTLEDLELIVVDDGSTDGTGHVLARHRDPRLRVLVNSGKSGIASALNLGLASAAGKYVARMDADDISLPHRLAAQISLLEQQPEIGVVASDIQYMTQSGTLTSRRTRLPASCAGVQLHLNVGNCLPHPTVVARREVLEQAGGYRLDRPAAEDYDLWLRMSNMTKLANVSEPLLWYRVHAANTSQVRQLEGASSVAPLLAERLSALLERPVSHEAVSVLLLPNRPRDLPRCTDPVLEAAAVLLDVAATARRAQLPARDASSIRRRCDDVMARIAATAASSDRATLLNLVRDRPLRTVASASRGSGRKLLELAAARGPHRGGAAG